MAANSQCAPPAFFIKDSMITSLNLSNPVPRPFYLCIFSKVAESVSPKSNMLKKEVGSHKAVQMYLLLSQSA